MTDMGCQDINKLKKVYLLYIILVLSSVRCMSQVDSLNYYSEIMTDISVNNVCNGNRKKAFVFLTSEIELGVTKLKFIKKYFGVQYFDGKNKRNGIYSYPISAKCKNKEEDLDDIEYYSLLWAVVFVQKGVVIDFGYKQ